MCPMVNTDDLCDAHDVALLLGLSHANSVFGYMRRYRDLPRPVVTAGRGRLALWLRPEIEAWHEAHPRRTSGPVTTSTATSGTVTTSTVTTSTAAGRRRGAA